MARSAPTPPPSKTVSSGRNAVAPATTFTAAEASATLVYLGPIVAEMRACFARIVAQRARLDRAPAAESPAAENLVAESLVAENQREMAELARLVDEVQAVGAEVRDFESGAVAFPGRGHGVPERGFLSWIHGEERVGHVHGADEPTEARRVLRCKARSRAA